MKGRKAVPTKIKQLRGTLRSCRVNRDEPKPSVVDISMPPNWLGNHGRAEWKRVVRSLPAGVITGVDLAVFETYCATYQEWREAVGRIAENGTEAVTARGESRASPDVILARNARRDLVRLATELGVTPASRSKVHAAPSSLEGPSKVAEIIGF